MKNALALLAFAFLIFCSCRKSTNNATLSEGLVVGFRAEKCLCCPGNLVKIGNDTLQFDQFPSNSPKIVKDYPYPVNLEWQADTSFCGQQNKKRIIVSKIEFL